MRVSQAVKVSLSRASGGTGRAMALDLLPLLQECLPFRLPPLPKVRAPRLLVYGMDQSDNRRILFYLSALLGAK